MGQENLFIDIEIERNGSGVVYLADREGNVSLLERVFYEFSRIEDLVQWLQSSDYWGARDYT